MAYTQKIGRSPLPQTGRGIPAPFLQVNISSGNDLKAQARAKAEAEAKAKLTAAGENKGTSKDVRAFEATATVTKEGKKVEKFAKTPKEIAAWKAASPENKAKYEKQSATETVKLSDVGKDKPMTPPKSEDYGSWTSESISQDFGGRSTTGYTQSAYDLERGDIKQAYDVSRGGEIKPGSNPAGNVYKHQKVTPQESRVQNVYGNIVSPYDKTWSDYGPGKSAKNPSRNMDISPGSGEKRRQEYIAKKTSELDLRDKTYSEKKATEKAKGEAMATRRTELVSSKAKERTEKAAEIEKAKEATKAKILAERAAKRAGKTGTTNSTAALQLRNKKKK